MTSTHTGRQGARGAHLTRRGAAALCGGVLTVLTALTGCTSGGSGATGAPAPVTSTAPTSSSSGPPSPTSANIYAHAGAGQLQKEALKATSLVYVPNTLSDTLQVIDPRTYRVIARYRTGSGTQGSGPC
jgi:YVTN family beta-propeller protein